MGTSISVYLLSDLLRALLWSAIELIVVVLAVQLTVMIVHKVVLERRERRIALLKSRYLSGMYRSFAAGSSEVERPNTAEEISTLADICIYLLTDASPSETAIIVATLRRCGVAGYYCSRLSSARSWIKRYTLVEKLGFMRLPELASLFRSILQSEHEGHHVVGKAAWALSLVCRGEDLPPLLARMSQPNFMSAKFNEHLFVNVIASFRARGETKPLLRLFEELPAGVPLLVMRDFIEACGNAGLVEAEPLIASWGARYAHSPEMRIACLRSRQLLGGEGLDLVVLAALGDEDWRVRAVAAKTVDKCSDAVIPALEYALGDAQYHVRVNAAVSLSHKGEKGRAALKRQSGSTDRFVREVSRYVMRESDLPC